MSLGIRKLIIGDFTKNKKKLKGKAYSNALAAALSPENIIKNSGKHDCSK